MKASWVDLTIWLLAMILLLPIAFMWIDALTKAFE